MGGQKKHRQAANRGSEDWIWLSVMGKKKRKGTPIQEYTLPIGDCQSAKYQKIKNYPDFWGACRGGLEERDISTRKGCRSLNTGGTTPPPLTKGVVEHKIAGARAVGGKDLSLKEGEHGGRSKGRENRRRMGGK